MRKTMKRALCAVAAMAMVFGMGACGEKKIPVIGISQYGEHGSLDNCREGFLQGLADAGLVEGTDFTVDYQNAGFDDNICTQIGQNFSAKNVDLMCGIATNAATACFAAAEDKDIPVIFTEYNGSDATAKAISRETGCQVAQLSMIMDGEDDRLESYINAQINNMKAVCGGFAKEAAAQ